MKTISMLQFRQRAGAVLKQVNKGQAFVLTFRGKPVARLEPIQMPIIAADDPGYKLSELATPKLEPLTNLDIDRIVYGS